MVIIICTHLNGKSQTLQVNSLFMEKSTSPFQDMNDLEKEFSNGNVLEPQTQPDFTLTDFQLQVQQQV